MDLSLPLLISLLLSPSHFFSLPQSLDSWCGRKSSKGRKTEHVGESIIFKSDNSVIGFSLSLDFAYFSIQFFSSHLFEKKINQIPSNVTLKELRKGENGRERERKINIRERERERGKTRGRERKNEGERSERGCR